MTRGIRFEDWKREQMRDPAFRFWYAVWWLRCLPERLRWRLKRRLGR